MSCFVVQYKPRSFKLTSGAQLNLKCHGSLRRIRHGLPKRGSLVLFAFASVGASPKMSFATPYSEPNRIIRGRVLMMHLFHPGSLGFCVPLVGDSFHLGSHRVAIAGFMWSMHRLLVPLFLDNEVCRAYSLFPLQIDGTIAVIRTLHF